MESLDAEQSLKMSLAIDKYVIPGYENSIGKPTIIAQLIAAGFDKEHAVQVVDRYEPSPGRNTPPGKPTRVDCPHCGAKSVYVTTGDDFAWGWAIAAPIVTLVHHFIFKSRGGKCSNCGENLSRRHR